VPDIPSGLIQHIADSHVRQSLEAQTDDQSGKLREQLDGRPGSASLRPDNRAAEAPAAATGLGRAGLLIILTGMLPLAAARSLDGRRLTPRDVQVAERVYHQ